MPNQALTKDQTPAGEKPDHKKFQIQIDRVHYTVTQEFMTGAELRRVSASCKRLFGNRIP